MSLAYDDERDRKIAKKLAKYLNEMELQGGKTYCDGDDAANLEFVINKHVVRERGVWVVEDR